MRKEDKGGGMMERLTIDYGEDFRPFRYSMKDGSDAEIGYFKNYDAFYSHMLMVQKLGEYEDLEEQGILLRLPCHIGDSIYSVIEDGLTIIELKFSLDFYVKRKNDFGKTVFLTQAEAEQKLKEMESD